MFELPGRCPPATSRPSSAPPYDAIGADGGLKTLFSAAAPSTAAVSAIEQATQAAPLVTCSRMSAARSTGVTTISLWSRTGSRRETGLYRVQARRRPAASEWLIAESDLFEPMAVNATSDPEFRGRVHVPAVTGFIVLGVMRVPSKQ